MILLAPIFKLLGLVLFEGVFVGGFATFCLAQPREREFQRVWRLRARTHEKLLAERGLRCLKLVNALHNALR